MVGEFFRQVKSPDDSCGDYLHDPLPRQGPFASTEATSEEGTTDDE